MRPFLCCPSPDIRRRCSRGSHESFQEWAKRDSAGPLGAPAGGDQKPQVADLEKHLLREPGLPHTLLSHQQHQLSGASLHDIRRKQDPFELLLSRHDRPGRYSAKKPTNR